MKFIVVIITFFISSFSLVGQEQGRMTFALRDEKGKIISEFTLVFIDGKSLYDSVYVNYHSNGKMKDSCYYEKGIIVGSKYYFDDKGRITVINEFIGNTFPREIKTKAYYYSSGNATYSEGRLIEKAPGEAVIDGVMKYYWKNGQLMDSVIFENNQKIYRAGFNKKGELQFENRY